MALSSHLSIELIDSEIYKKENPVLEDEKGGGADVIYLMCILYNHTLGKECKMKHDYRLYKYILPYTLVTPREGWNDDLSHHFHN